MTIPGYAFKRNVIAIAWKRNKIKLYKWLLVNTVCQLHQMNNASLNQKAICSKPFEIYVKGS